MTSPAIALTATRAPATGAPAESWAKPEHAVLETFEPKLVDGKDPQLGAPKGTIKFQFNPKEVTITKTAKWQRKETKNKKAPPAEYAGPGPCKMTLELFFDASMESGLDVVESVDRLFACCVPYKKFDKGQTEMPLLVRFTWGSVTSFAAYISQVQAKYTRFGPDGLPIRAVCTVNLEELSSDPDKQNPTSGTESIDNVHTMVAGDSLASVAFSEYGDARLWRNLAAYNGIDDPMRIADGTALLLPQRASLLSGSR